MTTMIDSVRRWTPGAPVLEAPPRATTRQLAARAAARRLLLEDLIPMEALTPECDRLPEDTEARLAARARELGLWAPATPSELGGQGLGELGSLLVHEQVAQSIVGDIRQDRGIGGDPWPALYHANPEQRRRFLDPYVAGTKSMFFALTEPSAGSDAASIQTRAVRRPGGWWSITGGKWLIGRAGYADFGVVFAVTDPTRGARGGVTCFIVEAGTPGLEMVREIETMGACRPYELRLTDCRVPERNVLGEVGTGFVLAQQTLSRTRIRQTAMTLGAAQRALDMLADWLPRRSTFQRSLSDRQPLRWSVARAAAELRAARLLAYRVAAHIDSGQDVRWEVPFAKSRAAQVACTVIDLAIQLHGGRGVSRDLPLERLYRDVRSMRITEGADEVQRDLVIRRLLGR